MGSIYDWSLAAADNANADDSINWAEGQPPSSVNNSARAMMQRVREFVGDLGGALVAGGTANAVSLSGNAAVSVYKSGIIVRFQASLANAAKTALSLNNLPPKPIFKSGAPEPAPLEGGELQPGGVYECVYNARLGSGGAWFLLSSFYTPPPVSPAPSVSAGFVAPYCGDRAPAGWLACDGAWVSRAAYGLLYLAVGKRFGADESRNLFRLPDLRGEFIRGWADMRADVPQEQRVRALGSWERGAVESHRHGGATDWSGAHSHIIPWNTTSCDGSGRQSFNLNSYNADSGRRTAEEGSHRHNFTTDWGINDDKRMAEETRPRNMALLYCIKC